MSKNLARSLLKTRKKKTCAKPCPPFRAYAFSPFLAPSALADGNGVFFVGFQPTKNTPLPTAARKRAAVGKKRECISPAPLFTYIVPLASLCYTCSCKENIRFSYTPPLL